MNTVNNAPPPLTKPGIHDAVMRVFQTERPGRVLDAPCGRGHLSHRLAAAGFEVFALDINDGDFEPRDIKFTAGDLNDRLPYPDGFFDYVVSVEGIEHLKGSVLLIEEFRRILKTGGVLVFTTPNINNFKSRIKFLLFGSFCYFNSRISSTHETWMAQHANPVWFPGLEQALENNGLAFETISADEKNINIFLRGVSALAGLVNRLFNKAYNPRLQSPELLFGENLVLKVRKDGAL